MKQTKEQFAGYDCVRLENEVLKLWVTHSVGPRIIGLQLGAGDNLMAVLPTATIPTPDGGVYQLYGGHRLWHAPEDAQRTYVADDTAVIISPIKNGVQTTQTVEALTGIEKQMRITLPDETAQVIIEHTLINRGVWPVELAPWAITQLRPGGFAILPQNGADTGLLPNRQLVFWPYARLDSPNLKLGNRFVLLQAAMQEEKFKMGWANPEGWLGYWIDGTLFVKTAVYQPNAAYYDLGSSSECYCDAQCLELETLGPRTRLAPGTAVTHRETWYLFDDVTLAAEETAVAEFLHQTGILETIVG